MAKVPSKLILFDVDGVILDSFDVLFKETKSFIRRKSGDTLDRDTYRRFFEGNPLKEIFQYLRMDHIGLLDILREIPVFFDTYPKTKLFRGIKVVLQKLAKSSPLVVITSSPANAVRSKFDDEGIGDLFSLYLGTQTAIHKDKKIRMAMEQFGVKKGKTWFITDTAGDIVEAKETGVHTIAATWGYHPRETLEKAKPDFLVDRPSDLIKILQT